MKTSIIILFFLLNISVSAFSQSADFIQARAQATQDIKDLNLYEDSNRNIWLDKSTNTIHVFVFEDGNLLSKGYPTTATDRNKFVVHLYQKNIAFTYRFEASGTYAPELVTAANAKSISAKALYAASNIQRLDFGPIGPLTTTVTFTIKKAPIASGVVGTYADLTSAVMKIANTIHVSLGTGFFYTGLHNPTDIHGVPMPTQSGPKDSTLLANHPNGSGFLALVATYYPYGRSSLIMPGKPIFNKENIGFVIGTNIASTTTNFKNILVGLSYDFSLGGSFVAGMNVDTDRQRIYGYDNFKFGTDKFTGKLPNKLYKDVGVGYFFGVQVDSRIFTKLFAKE